MKKYLHILLLLIVLVGFLQAEARYASRMTQDGTIFFIEPHKLTDLGNIKKFEYDMTLLSWTDSVTVNFTFESDRLAMPQNLTVKSGDNVFVCTDFSDLFYDLKKNHYEIRITSKFSVDEIREIIKSENPPVFSFIQDGVNEYASYKSGSWRKDRKRLLKILQLFLFSKQ